jgi:hypothetical protein
MPTDDLARCRRQNPAGPPDGPRDAGILSVGDPFGKANHRWLFGNACPARFSAFKGTPPFHAKLPHEKALAILPHRANGRGVGQPARLAGVNQATVARLARLAKGVECPPKTGSPTLLVMEIV